MPHAQYTPPAHLTDALERFRSTDEPFALLEEVALARASLQRHLENTPTIDKSKGLVYAEAWAAHDRGVWSRLDYLTKFVESAAKTQALESASLHEVVALLDNLHGHLMQAMQRCVKDAKERQALEAAWQQLRVIPQRRMGKTFLVLEAGKE